MNKDQLNLAAEFLYYERLLTEVAPTGILSLVADTNDFWGTVTRVVPALKETILGREGKLVIRPDSGDPVDILCGTVPTVSRPLIQSTRLWMNDRGYDVIRHLDGKYYGFNPSGGKIFVEVEPTPQQKGLIECLWETFGGTTTPTGYRILDEHVGAIYGDAITLERQQQIAERLMAKGFAPQVVLGVGSFSYQYVTRDTHGSAIKSTNVTKRIEGEVGSAYRYDQAIAKDPKTDSKKKSAKGLLRVELENGKYVMYDNQTREQEAAGELRVIFEDGVEYNTTTLEEVRASFATTM